MVNHTKKENLHEKRVTHTNVSKEHADRRMDDINPFLHKATQIQWERGGEGVTATSYEHHSSYLQER